MRVIAGKYRGRPLVSPEGDAIRPTTDKVKESIFGSIQFDVEGSVFVDLFAGSGAMGIEALSRGAREVIFVDEARSSIAVVKANIEKVKVDSTDTYSIVNGDFARALESMKTKADIIFVDPPYRDKPLHRILTIVRDRDLLSEGGKIIYEHLFEDGDAELIDGFERVKAKRYGTIAVEVIKAI